MSPYLVAPDAQDIKVELEIPKPIMDLLQAAEQFAGIDPKKYLERVILDGVFADVDIMDGTSFWDPKTVRRKYGLNQILHVNQIHESPEKEPE